MQKITPFLWFDGQAEEAANYYVSIFKDSRIKNIVRHGDAGPGPKGTVLTVDLEIEGQRFTALNGGPQFKFNESVSFVVHCKTQAEVDYYWDRLCADGGKPVACGWLKDKFGLSWQITPDMLLELIQSKDTAKADRVMRVMMNQVKLDIAELQRAAEGA